MKTLELLKQALPDIKDQLLADSITKYLAKNEPFDNEKFFLEKVVLGKKIVVNDAPEPFEDEIVTYDGDGNFIYSIQKNGNVWFNYDTIWSVLQSKNDWNYQQIQAFLKEMLEKHLKMKDVTPSLYYSPNCQPLEKHLKMKDVTPYNKIDFSINKLEKHLKMKDVTPQYHHQIETM